MEIHSGSINVAYRICPLSLSAGGDGVLCLIGTIETANSLCIDVLDIIVVCAVDSTLASFPIIFSVVTLVSGLFLITQVLTSTFMFSSGVKSSLLHCCFKIKNDISCNVGVVFDMHKFVTFNFQFPPHVK